MDQVFQASIGSPCGSRWSNGSCNTKTVTYIQAEGIANAAVVLKDFPEDGILFPKGIFCKTKTNVTAYTLFTDKYSGPGLTAE